jgi:predicted helicase
MYRETYKEFLKIDFPRIPYPKDAGLFHHLSAKGAELLKLHLMEGVAGWATKVSFPINGDNIVDKPEFQDGKVYINKDQYFGNVSELAWNFFIGGYQPAQKWLKDRKGRKLEWEDLMHYGRIVYALQETDRIMKEIDEVFQK